MIRSQLEIERSSFLSQWRDLNDYIRPTRARFVVTDANRGDRKNLKIIDSTPTLAARTLQSGMMSGVTSPARPWFNLTTPDPKLADSQSSKRWLHSSTTRMRDNFARTNLYNVLPTTYGDLGSFATAPIIIDDAPASEGLLKFKSVPVGSYMIATDPSGKVCVFVYDYRMTVRQLMKEFGIRDEKGQIMNWENFSAQVKSLYEQRQLESWVDVTMLVEENDEYNPNLLEAKYKRYSVCYFERGSQTAATPTYSDESTRYLRESGSDYFKVLVPRWEVTGEDAYGTNCPGMTALGDIKALQTMQKRKAQAIEKKVNPPLVGPTALRNQKVSQVPGDITYADVREGLQGLRSIHDVNFQIQELVMDIQETQRRINEAFFASLIMSVSMDNRATPATATEISARKQEELVAFGPVLEQLNQDLLNPLIDIMFARMVEEGQIDEPPEELQGMPLRVDYISVMAQAQKLVGIGSMERFTGYIGQLAAFAPSVLDKIDVDEMADVYADMTSVNPKIVRSDDDVAAMREARAEQAKQAADLELASQAAKAVKDLSQATGGGNMANELMGTA
jgi:hypothetical protein